MKSTREEVEYGWDWFFIEVLKTLVVFGLTCVALFVFENPEFGMVCATAGTFVSVACRHHDSFRNTKVVERPKDENTTLLSPGVDLSREGLAACQTIFVNYAIPVDLPFVSQRTFQMEKEKGQPVEERQILSELEEEWCIASSSVWQAVNETMEMIPEGRSRVGTKSSMEEWLLRLWEAGPGLAALEGKSFERWLNYKDFALVVSEIAKGREGEMWRHVLQQPLPEGRPLIEEVDSD